MIRTVRFENYYRMPIIALAMICISSAIAGCSEERVSNPSVGVQRLYVGMHGAPASSQAWVRVLDCRTDSIVDSMSYPGMSRLLLGFASPDGKYLATLESGRPTRIWDVTQGLQVADLGQAQVFVTFLPRQSLAVSATLDSTYFYSVPSFAVDTAVGHDLRILKVIPGTHRILAVSARGNPASPRDYSLLYLIDATARSIIDSFVIDGNAEGIGLSVYSMDVSGDGRYLYALGSTNQGIPSFVGFDLDQRVVLYRKYMFSATGSCSASPAGSEVWVTDPGSTNAQLPPLPGLIRVFEAKTGFPLDSIVTAGYHPSDSSRPLFVKDIRFVPGSEKVYVNTGRVYQEGHSILVVNSRSHEIIDVIYDEPPYPNGFIDVGPVP